MLDRLAISSPATGANSPSWPPQPTPMPTSAQLLARLDAAWTRSDWPQTLALLDQLERVDPSELDFGDKRYAVHMAAGQNLLAKGNKDAAVVEFVRADAIDQRRSEAKTALLALTPTPTPLPATATPLPKPTPPPSRSGATTIDPRRLAADPRSFVGQNVVLRGEALTVTQESDYTWVQVMAQVPGRPAVTESIVVELVPRNPNVLRSECYAFYGVVRGTETVTRTLTGASNEVPVVTGYAADAIRHTNYGLSCAER